MRYGRTDLLELSTEALIALSNVGFVKKGIKDLEAGLLPRLEEDQDGNLHGYYDDGSHVTLPPGRTLREAQCSCPASGICRHRVTLILAYQAAAAARGNSAENNSNHPAEAEEPGWNPGSFDDGMLLEVLTKSRLQQAQKLAAAGMVATVQGGHDVPTVRFAMCTVRFFSRSSLAHARCDCKEGSGCCHVALAVWAFRQAAQEHPNQAEAVIELRLPEGIDGADRAGCAGLLAGDGAAATLMDEIENWLNRIWSGGAAQPLSATEAQVRLILAQCDQLGWRWVGEEVREIRDMIIWLHGRSSRFDQQRLLCSVAALPARLQAAGCMEASSSPRLPARQILGIGEKGEMALDHLNLTSLGLEIWGDDNGQGADLVFMDHDTQTLMLLERYWPQQEGQTKPLSWQDLMGKRVSGKPLRQMANGQIITKTATRRANGSVDISSTNRLTNVFPLSPKSWDNIKEPVRQHGPCALARHLQQQLPAFVRPVQNLGNFHVVSLEAAQVADYGWDAAQQKLHAVIISGSAEDAPLQLSLPNNPLAPHAIDAALQILSGELGPIADVAGMAWLENGQPFLHPLAILTRDRSVVLQAADAPTTTAPHGRQLGDSTPLGDAVHSAREILAHWLRRGVRQMGKGEYDKALELEKVLAGCGLRSTAAAFAGLHKTLTAADFQQLSRQLSTIILLLDQVTQKGIGETGIRI